MVWCSGAPRGRDEERSRARSLRRVARNQQIDQDAAVRRRRAPEKSNKGASGGFDEGLR